MVRVAVITGYGINADRELFEAFTRTGGHPERIHIQDLFESPKRVLDFQILSFPGGFSFGDHLGSGLVLSHLVKQRLRSILEEFVAKGGLVIGICNGFQVLVKMGLLPNLSGTWDRDVSLIHNNSGVFEDSWVKCAFPESECVWTKGLTETDLPVRHGEGRFICNSTSVLNTLQTKRMVAVTYSDRNPNGSVENIAGITDTTGRVLGLMPHPEAFLSYVNHPSWRVKRPEPENGLAMFRNAVTFFNK
ncbi:MAG: phosphoribosylformylglycinamidine synthase subunit PurQ [Spirochaetia bacterium]